MSSNLYWRPADNNGRDLPDALKLVLRERFGYPVSTTLGGETCIFYLRGLVDAGVTGAAELLRAVEKHERVRVEEVW